MVVQGAGVGLCPHGSARSWSGSVSPWKCKELGWVCVPMVVQGAGVGLCPHGSARSWGGSVSPW